MWLSVSNPYASLAQILTHLTLSRVLWPFAAARAGAHAAPDRRTRHAETAGCGCRSLCRSDGGAQVATATPACTKQVCCSVHLQTLTMNLCPPPQRWPLRFKATAARRFRHSDDMQYAFSCESCSAGNLFGCVTLFRVRLERALTHTNLMIT